MPINPHLTPLCKFCVHSLYVESQNLNKFYYSCNNEESEHFENPVNDEAKECNLYRTDTNLDEFKEQINGGW